MNLVRIRILATAFVLVAVASAQQQLTPKLQNAVGHWQVINADGSKGGHVDTYIENGKLLGRVTAARPGRDPNSLCDKCSGELKNQHIMGMIIIKDFHPEGDDWVGGTLVDPENGKVYKGKIWAVGSDKLGMRGYVGISLLGRSATWERLP
ncbi:DUF2147 domain-containing protein [Telmatobacter sp. DSM 110680]|uniref:DUF2147 domain-containing protein n=1 Tax=Telmatobacter sp. DSM 110680 TaxID=3036704 RepID=A0AAU7DEM9_9BACT